MKKEIKKIVIARNGLLGDTLVALPALWILKKNFPKSEIYYVYEKFPGKLNAEDILKNTGLVDYFYSLRKKGIAKIFSIMNLFLKIRFGNFDLGIELEEPHWPGNKKKFLEFCGVKKVIGPDGRGQHLPRDKEGKLIEVKPISESLLEILSSINIKIPKITKDMLRLPASNKDKDAVDGFLRKKGNFVNNKIKIAVGPFSKTPCKRWPLENYKGVIRALILKYDVIPVIFGSENEKELGEELINHWKVGINAAGVLSISESVELMKRCNLFLGNDSGVMHMAVSAGLPCVAIFSARDSPKRWEPYGLENIILRKHTNCEGCLLDYCREKKMECIKSIKQSEVLGSCLKLLNNIKRKNA